MKKGFLALISGFALVAALAAGGPARAQGAPVGEVIFTIGQAKLLAESGRSIAVGEKVHVGQTLATGPNGHIHIRFVDQAFVSLRPDSVLKIEDYHYNPDKPEASRVKFLLTQGTSRLISGKAGQSAKQNFRLNTPVSAIGIRGTDFVVNTSATLTRVAVYQGAIVAAPFDAACTATGSGPCAGALAKDLSGSLSNQFLEVKKDGGAPELVAPKDGTAGKVFTPANPKEPGVGARSSAAGVNSVAAESSFNWGRWSASSAVPEGFELISQANGIALFRKTEQIDLPKAGLVSFGLVQAEGYARASDGTLAPASVSNAKLSVNFDTMRYSTSFNWANNSKMVGMVNKGAISDTGRFVANRSQSNFNLSGALNATGNEAAYMFIKRLEGDDAFGVLRFKR